MTETAALGSFARTTLCFLERSAFHMRKKANPVVEKPSVKPAAGLNCNAFTQQML
jgi:hypothetical protein